jgi:hypothetical protein
MQLSIQTPCLVTNMGQYFLLVYRNSYMKQYMTENIRVCSTCCSSCSYNTAQQGAAVKIFLRCCRQLAYTHTPTVVAGY